MLKYSQVVWAYFILDAASILATATKLVEPQKTASKDNVATVGTDASASASAGADAAVISNNENPQLGLFVAQPSNIRELIREPTYDPDYVNLEPRYARNFGMISVPSKRTFRGISPQSLSLFTKLDKKDQVVAADAAATNATPRKGKKKDDLLPPARGSDKFLTPEFYKFKTEIDKDTKKTRIKGLKISKDASPSQTIVYEKPAKFSSRNRSPRPLNPIREETYTNPYIYEETTSYDDGTYTPYAKPVSYQQYSSIPSEPYYPSTSSGYHDYSDYSYPSYPTVDPEPYYSPRTELEARNKYPESSTYNDVPLVYHHNTPTSSINYQQDNNNHHQGYYPKTKQVDYDKEEPEEAAPAGEEDFDKDFQSTDYAAQPKKQPFRHQNQDVEYRSNPSESTKFRSQLKNRLNKSKFGKSFADDSLEDGPAAVGQDDEEDDFDSNYETADAFQDDKDDNADDEDVAADEEPPPKRGKLKLPSRKQVKRVQGRPSNHHKKRCVKKRKEMSVDDIGSGNFDEEPGKQMTCLVCENLDTGGTYETCSYESDPKKNSYLSGNEASYRKGGASGGGGSSSSSKIPYKYRLRREVTIINRTHPMKQIVRRSYNEDTIGSFTSDVEEFGPEDFTDDDNEEQQEDDDDDLEEYKPSPPAYANEDSCAEVTKNGLTCMVCHNPETNGKYKQCSYATDPNKDNYEYAQSSSYGSQDVPYKERYRRKAKALPSEWKQLRDVEQKKIEAINDNFKKLIRTKKEQPDSEALANIENPSYEEQFLNLFPELAGGSAGEPIRGESSLLQELNEKSILSSSDDNDIPGFGSKKKLGGYFKGLPKKSILDRDDDDDDDSEMSKMMKEFKTKDRSACKKTIKDKMTCYTCDDADGMKREECMYVVESEPTKVSYAESKQTKTPDEKHQVKSSRKREIYKKPPLDKRVMRYKYIPPFQVPDQPYIGSVTHQTISRDYVSPQNPNSFSKVQMHTEKTYSRKGIPSSRIVRRGLPKFVLPDEPETKGSDRKEIYRRGKTKARRDDDSNVEDPEENGEYTAVEVVPEADPSSPDGAFSDETIPMYSSEMKITLPRYMLEKSEHEKIIDDFMSKM